MRVIFIIIACAVVAGCGGKSIYESQASSSPVERGLAQIAEAIIIAAFIRGLLNK